MAAHPATPLEERQHAAHGFAPCSHLARELLVGDDDLETPRSERDERDYTANVDGASFMANGHTFENDADFAFTLDNDSQSKCLVVAVDQ